MLLALIYLSFVCAPLTEDIYQEARTELQTSIPGLEYAVLSAASRFIDASKAAGGGEGEDALSVALKELDSASKTYLNVLKALDSTPTGIYRMLAMDESWRPRREVIEESFKRVADNQRKSLVERATDKAWQLVDGSCNDSEPLSHLIKETKPERVHVICQAVIRDRLNHKLYYDPQELIEVPVDPFSSAPMEEQFHQWQTKQAAMIKALQTFTLVPPEVLAYTIKLKVTHELEGRADNDTSRIYLMKEEIFKATEDLKALLHIRTQAVTAHEEEDTVELSGAAEEAGSDKLIYSAVYRIIAWNAALGTCHKEFFKTEFRAFFSEIAAHVKKAESELGQTSLAPITGFFARLTHSVYVGWKENHFRAKNRFMSALESGYESSITSQARELVDFRLSMGWIADPERLMRVVIDINQPFSAEELFRQFQQGTAALRAAFLASEAASTGKGVRLVTQLSVAARRKPSAPEEEPGELTSVFIGQDSTGY